MKQAAGMMPVGEDPVGVKSYYDELTEMSMKWYRIERETIKSILEKAMPREDSGIPGAFVSALLLHQMLTVEGRCFEFQVSYCKIREVLFIRSKGSENEEKS